jgi:soluble lytic murein transglycosylase
MGHWNHQSDPTPFALAEYNAGASRAQCWSGGNGVAEMPERQFLQKIDFPATRRYVESILDRYKFYQRRGHVTTNNVPIMRVGARPVFAIVQ